MTRSNLVTIYRDVHLLATVIADFKAKAALVTPG